MLDPQVPLAYGTCREAPHCRCGMTAGMHCPNWQPAVARTAEELAEWQKQTFKRSA